MARTWRGGEGGRLPDAEDNPPEGFVFSEARGPFTSHNGPFFHKVTDEGFWHGFRVRDHHLNGHGIAHGGLLMAFADGLMGTAVWRATKTRAVTMRMTSDLLDMVRPSEWVEGTAHVTRATRSVAFVEAEISSGRRQVLRASGVFKLLGPVR
jgi:acyl-coenzyme A thioesterase PaaI-like protein